MRSRIFIVDDHHDFAKALRYVFAETPELEVCCTATDLEEAFRLIPISDADLVTLDIRLGYLAKGTPPSEIVRAARLLLAGCEYFPRYGSWRK